MAWLHLEKPIRAVLCDVDGTLYHQNVLRAFMAYELGLLPITTGSWSTARSTWHSLRLFRHIREELRQLEEAPEALETLQYQASVQHGQCSYQALEQIVCEWIYQRPLKYLRFCRRRGLTAFVAFLESRGIAMGVFSDYPVMDKLRNLGIADHVSVALCATDPQINAFKPCPKGFLYACALWGLSPDQVLYVGDRPEVDAAGAARAGMPCVILARQTRRPSAPSGIPSYGTLSSFAGLQHALAAHC